MTSFIGLNIVRFIVLILVQVLILQNVNFLGYINPYIYILFILLYPIQNNRLIFLTVSFFLGLCVDIFLDSGGVHAAASVFIAYLRPLFLKFTFGASYEHQTVKIGSSEAGLRATYFGLMILVHHLMMFSLEVFNSSKVLLILKKTLFSSIFTFILCILITILFSRKPK